MGTTTLNQVEAVQVKELDKSFVQNLEFTNESEELPLAINFRDLAEVDPSKMRARRVFRCSEMFRIELLKVYDIKTLVDMRKKETEKETHPVYCALESGALASAKDFKMPKVFAVNMISFQKNLVMRKKRSFAKASVLLEIRWCLVKGKMSGLKACDVMCHAVADRNTFGFHRLYQIIVDKAAHEIAETMRIFADEKNYPILMHCVHGKDRTGIITFLLTSLCEISLQEILDDYSESETMLKDAKATYSLPLSSDLLSDEVLAADDRNIVELLDHINEHYGSLEGYLKHIGLTEEELGNIRKNLSKKEGS